MPSHTNRGLNTKLHAVTDSLSRPHPALFIAAGQVKPIRRSGGPMRVTARRSTATGDTTPTASANPIGTGDMALRPSQKSPATRLSDTTGGMGPAITSRACSDL